MFGEISLSVWLLGGLAFAAVLVLLRSQFSAEARLARRRRKNYGHTVSKGKGPMVKLAVRTQQPKE
jgi:hypothetical protein